jgi:hypothetical protein
VTGNDANKLIIITITEKVAITLKALGFLLRNCRVVKNSSNRVTNSLDEIDLKRPLAVKCNRAGLL